MFPFFSAGSQVGIAMTALYALLGITSLSVRAKASSGGALRAQVNSWWRIFPVVTAALLAYPYGVFALACLICWLAVRELAPHTDVPPRSFHTGAYALVMVILFLQWQALAVLPVLMPAAVAAQFMYFCARPARRPLIRLLLMLVIATCWVLVQFVLLPQDTSANLAWLFYLFVSTALNDIGQFVFGKIFGNRRIAPTISPNKTWQGLAGGLLVSQLLTLALGTWLELATPIRMAAYAVLLSLGGFAGDLLFSAAKRYLGIKDFSQLIPGHGWILDRIDSLVVTAPLLYCLICLFE